MPRHIAVLVIASGFISGCESEAAKSGPTEAVCFDWQVDQVRTSGALSVKLMRVALLPCTKENLRAEHVCEEYKKPGEHAYFVVERSMTVNGKPVSGKDIISSIGPDVVEYDGSPLKIIGTRHVNYGADSEKRPGWMIHFERSVDPPKTRAPLTLKFAVTLKDNTKLNVSFDGLQIPIESLRGK